MLNHRFTSSFWHHPRFRAILFQIVIASAVIIFFSYIIHNTLHNLQQRGITTGFAFLSSQAGFGILQTLIDYNETSSYGRAFLVGLLNTLLISVLGIMLATLLGFVIGIARLSNNWLVAKLAVVYIEIVRNIPLLLQIFFWYVIVLQALPAPRQSWEWGQLIFLNIRGFYLPKPILGENFIWVELALLLALFIILQLTRWATRRQAATGQPFPVFYTALVLLLGLPLLTFFISGRPLTWDLPELKGFNFRGGITVIPELTALLIALSTYTAAFIAEIVRSGIQSVSKGQTEAAYALGLTRRQTLRWVILPQALRVIIPPLTSQYLNLTKNSSLATALGYPDLVSVFAGTTLNQTGQAIEVMAITMATYLVISLLISLGMNWYNSSMKLVEK